MKKGQNFEMKVCVIYGNMRHGSTYHCVRLIKEELQKLEPLEVSEFAMPKAMPGVCAGCFSCIMKGEDSCPHSGEMQPIVSALDAADLIVLASPVYVGDVSGQMKVFLDHLAYRWLPHRPHPAMFQKLGLAVTTSAGAGLSHTAKTMKENLSFWGVRRVFVMKKAVAAMSFERVGEKKKAQIQKQAAALASKIHKAYQKGGRLHVPVFNRVLFAVMKGMQKGNDWNKLDRDHWEKQGWLSGKHPF